ncbi:MAG: hypothetical protein WBV94_02555 [Blastocatellia bacterium]
MNPDQTFRYNNDRELEQLARRFESCELQADDLHHRAHVALSVWYFLRLPEPVACARIHDGLQRFVRHHRVNVYNETITLFWMKLARQFVASADAGRTALELVNDSMSRLGDSRIIFDYYSRERLNSDEARLLWVEPDLKPLDFACETGSRHP